VTFKVILIIVNLSKWQLPYSWAALWCYRQDDNLT